MARTVMCKKLQKELPGLDVKPWPNELGQRIYDSISKDAWKMWTEHFKMIMNEYRLAGGSEQANQILVETTFTAPERPPPESPGLATYRAMQDGGGPVNGPHLPWP